MQFISFLEKKKEIIVYKGISCDKRIQLKRKCIGNRVKKFEKIFDIFLNFQQLEFENFNRIIKKVIYYKTNMYVKSLRWRCWKC